jgi:hypothetical protein
MKLVIRCGSKHKNFIFLLQVEKLKALKWPCRVCIQGFTQRVSFYMKVRLINLSNLSSNSLSHLSSRFTQRVSFYMKVVLLLQYI